MTRVKLSLFVFFFVLAIPAKATIISVTVDIEAYSTVADIGVSTGLGSGSYNTNSGELLLSQTTTTSSNIHNFTVISESQYNGLDGAYRALACLDLGSLYDICGSDPSGDLFIPLNVWSPLTVFFNSVDNHGNGQILSQLSNKYGTTVTSKLTISPSPVPAPASIWLFSSALLGLSKIKRGS